MKTPVPDQVGRLWDKHNTWEYLKNVNKSPGEGSRFSYLKPGALHCICAMLWLNPPLPWNLTCLYIGLMLI